jgi:hypothetical protein
MARLPIQPAAAHSGVAAGVVPQPLMPDIATISTRPWRLAGVAALVALALAACSDGPVAPPRAGSPTPAADLVAAAGGENVVLFWNEALLDAVSESTLGPPMVARALAVVHTAIFDAWAAYDDVALGTRLGGDLRRPAAERTAANRHEAISFAAYRTLVDLFPAQEARFGDRMEELGYDPDDLTTDPTRGAGIGNLAAAAMLAFCHADGANQLGDLHPSGLPYADYTGYEPRNSWDRVDDPNAWQPLAVPIGGDVVIQRFIAPHWDRVTPFALTSPDQFRPPPPALFPHGRYRAQAEELIHMSARLTDRDKAIVEYWADGPRTVLPPGHWLVFGRYVSQRDGHDMDDDVKLFFILANAVFDAGIASWDAKIHYDYVRPITAIRYLKAGKKIRTWGGPGLGTRVIDGEGWIPFQPVTFPTPPFSEYVSGHSTFSAAGAEVLRRFTGSDAFGLSVTVPAGSFLAEPGAPAAPVTLSWPTFSAAADEAGISRRLGGIHFRDGDLAARAMGRAVGEVVWEKARAYIEGTPGS